MILNNSPSKNNLTKHLSVPIIKKKLTNSSQKICVIVRKRPCSQKEKLNKEEDIISVNKEKNCIIVKEKKLKVDLTKFTEEHIFNFDIVYDEKKTNEEIYLEAVRPLIQYTFSNNAKITCFAYGQTGSGKTYTMIGNNDTNPGLYLLASYDIFSLISEPKYNNITIYISFYEIYCGKIYDLLNSRKILNILEDSKGQINIVGITEFQVNDLSTLINIIKYGINLRSVGVTGGNNDSSRSHGIIQISLKDSKTKKLKGKISFIDLAGSERAKDTLNTNKQTKFDGAEINKSLLALKECIRALDHCKKHTPFRGSKLTLVLRDSFIGNCKTLMIANINPCQSASEITLNTLRYADRVKELKHKNNKKIINDNLNTSRNCNNSRNNLKKDNCFISNKISPNRTFSNLNTFAKKNDINKKEKRIKKVLTRNYFNNSLEMGNSFNNSDFIHSNNSNNISVNKKKKKNNSSNNIIDINDNDNNNYNYNSNNNDTNNNTYKIVSTIMLKKPPIKVSSNININSLNFLNEYTNCKHYLSNSIENPEEIKKKQEEYINQINLKRNKMLIEHKIHIGNMVNFLQKELEIIKTINNNLKESPDFLYESLEKNYEEQISSISKIQNNIKDLRKTIKMTEKL